jgi:hypothetical protein
MLCLFLRAALLGRTNRLAAIESDSLTPQRWLNCNDIPRARQLRLKSLIARDSPPASSRVLLPPEDSLTTLE